VPFMSAVSAKVKLPEAVSVPIWILLKVLELLVKLVVPSKITVLLPAVNVGEPEMVKSADTVNVPDGAVKVPLDRVSVLLTSTAPVEPVKIPPEIVRPPLKVCVPVEAE